MAISATTLKLRLVSTGQYVISGRQCIPDIRVGAATDYTLFELVNIEPDRTLTGAKVWLTVDLDGVSVALAVPDATARDDGYYWGGSVDATGFTYSTPTTAAAGIAIPDLAPGQKTLVALRRVATGGSAATPEINVLRVDGTSPP